MLLKTTEWQTDRQSSTQRCCHNDAMQIRNDSSAGHVRGRWAWNLGAGLRSALVKRFDNSKQASDGTNCPTNENGTTVNHLCCRSAVCMQRMLMHIQALDMKCYFKVRSVYHTKRRYIRSRLWPTNFSEPMNIQNRWNDVTSAACLALRRESRGDLVFSKSQDHQARELSLALLHDGDVPGYWFNDGDVLWPPSTTIQRKVILCRRRSTQLYTFSRQMEFLKLGWHKYTLAAESSSAHAPSKHHNQHKLGTGVRRPHAHTNITHREPPTSTHCPDSLRHCGKIGSDPSWSMLEIVLCKTSRLFCRMLSHAAFLIRSVCPRVIPIDCTTAARACADRACAESLLYFGKHVQRYTLVKKEFETRTL